MTPAVDTGYKYFGRELEAELRIFLVLKAAHGHSHTIRTNYGPCGHLGAAQLLALRHDRHHLQQVDSRLRGRCK